MNTTVLNIKRNVKHQLKIKRDLNTMDKFFTPKKKCVNENDDIQVVEDSNGGKKEMCKWKW